MILTTGRRGLQAAQGRERELDHMLDKLVGRGLGRGGEHALYQMTVIYVEDSASHHTGRSQRELLEGQVRPHFPHGLR